MSAPPAQRITRREKLGIAAVVVAAFLVRALRAGDGLPYLHHWDEPHTAGRALRMVTTGDWNPHWFHYGTLTMYLNAGMDVLHFLWLCAQPDDAPAFARSLADIRTWPDEPWRWSISHPSFYAWNRTLTALFGAGCVLLAWSLARRMLGPLAALVAALALAALPIHVAHSAYVTTDVPAGFFALAVVWAAHGWASTGRPSTLVLAFVLTGLAVAVKYNAWIAWLVPLAALAVSASRGSSSHRPWLWAAAVSLPALAFTLAMPWALLDWTTFLDHVGREVSHYRVLGHGPEFTVEPGLEHAGVQLANFAASLTWPGLVIALAGWIVVARRPGGWLVLLFPILYFAFMTRMRVGFHRNFIALYPFLALGLAASFAWLEQRAARLGSARVRPIGIALVLGALVLVLARSARQSLAIASQIETRSQAVDRLVELARERGWTKVGIEAELRVHPIDLKRLPAGVAYEVLPLKELLARAGELDALLAAADHGQARSADDLRGWDGKDLDRSTESRETIARIEGGPLGQSASKGPGVIVLAGR